MATTTTTTCNWAGKSGKVYSYHVFPLGFAFKGDQPGNYIYAKTVAPGKWVAQYIGQTKDLKDRLGDHEKEACAKRKGATHIHAHLNPTVVARLVEEKDLIQNFDPSCNTHHII